MSSSAGATRMVAVGIGLLTLIALSVFVDRERAGRVVAEERDAAEGAVVQKGSPAPGGAGEPRSDPARPQPAANAVVSGRGTSRTVRVRCTDHRKSPLGRVGVVAYGPRGEERRALADRLGNAEFLLPSLEEWELVASSPEHGCAFAAIAKGGPTRRELVLTGSGSIDGVAETSAGVGVAGLVVQLVPAQVPLGAARIALSRSARTDAAGRFRLPGLGRGVAYLALLGGEPRRSVHPPESIRMVIDPKWSIELRREDDTELELRWEVSSTGERMSMLKSRRSTSGIWPPGYRRLLVPAWPGSSRVTVQIRFGAASYSEMVALPDGGGGATVRVEFATGSRRVRLTNPHAHAAAVFRCRTGSERSARFVLEAGETRLLPAASDRSRFRSAVFPRGVAEWDVGAAANSIEEVAIPSGPPGTGVRLVVTDGEGIPVETAVLVFHPAPDPGTWAVAYLDRRPVLFSGGLKIGGEAYVIAPAGAVRCTLSAPGYEPRTENWPRSGRLTVTLSARGAR